MENTSNNTVLILGVSGRFGGACKVEFERNNWNVKTFDRKADDLIEKSTGCDFIVMGWHPPYPDWNEQVPEITNRVIAAAKASGARVVIPGNVYVYGSELGLTTNEQTPHKANNPLGEIRRDMERSYKEAGIKTLLVRAGDFIDTTASGNWFDMVICKDLKKGKFTYPGSLDQKHTFAYLPDLARAIRMLCDKAEVLPQNEEFVFAGYSLTGKELQMAAEPTAKTKSFPWWSMYLAKPFWPLAKYLLEMRYLWNVEHTLDDSKLRAALPEFVATPIEEAMIEATKNLK